MFFDSPTSKSVFHTCFKVNFPLTPTIFYYNNLVQVLDSVSRGLTYLSISPNSVIQGWNNDVRGWNNDVRGWNNDVRGWNNDVRGWNNDVRGWNNDVRGWNNDNRGLNNDNRGLNDVSQGLTKLSQSPNKVIYLYDSLVDIPYNKIDEQND